MRRSLILIVMVGALSGMRVLAEGPSVTKASASIANRFVVIAHRGASGYLPEHTLEAASMAHAMGADFIEQDVVLTRDNVPVVLHDIHLDTVTDVVKKFPQRHRQDGRYYAVDFTLLEIKTLSVTERINRETNQAVYPDRFPSGPTSFQIPTLEEELQLVRGLNKSTRREVGVYVEVKSPAWHRNQGKDISKLTLDMLAKYGYRDRSDPAFVQCFDAEETKRMRRQLKTRLRLIQLIGENDWNEASTDFEALRTIEGLREIATYADGIGPWIPHIVTTRENQTPRISSLVEQAHAQNLLVHPYTFREDSLPKHINSSQQLLHILINEAKVDGLFTDFPDRVVHYRTSSAR